MSATFTILHEAAGRGDMQTIDDEIAKGVDLNVVGHAGSPIYVAACAGHWLIVLRLLSAGADPNAGRCGKYPLSRAAEAGENDVVKALLAAGADVNVVGWHNVAVDDEDDKNAEFSPLMIAAWHKHWPVVLTLIAAGADVNDVTFEGSPLIWLAHRSRATDVLDALIADPRTNLNATFRAEKRHARIGQADKMYQYTLIAAASEWEDWPLVLRLAAAGANVDQVDGADWSVLQRAAFYHRHGVVQALLEAGADPNLADAPALHFANSAAMVRTLVAAGAVVDAKDKRGTTALGESRPTDAQEALIEAGANVNAVDNDNMSIVEYAARESDARFVQMLLDRGAVFDWTKDDEISLRLAILADREDEFDRVLAKGTVDLNEVLDDRDMLLEVAVVNDRASMVTKLLGHGASIEVFDKRFTEKLLYQAASKGFDATARVLLAAGANPNSTGHGGETALHTAAENGHADIVRLLIDAGALTNTTTIGNRHSPLLDAAINEHWHIVAMLARAQHVLHDDVYALELAIAAGPSARDAMLALLDAGASLEAVLREAVELEDADRVVLALAAGADATNAPVNAVLYLQPPLIAAGWRMPIETLSPAELEEVVAAIPFAKKAIECAGFAMIRERVLEICVALQTMHLPAPQLIEIVTAECEPFARQLPYHYLWDAVVLVKHFHDRSSAAN